MTGRPVQARDLDVLRVEYLHYRMEHHLEAAEKAVTAYSKVDERLEARYRAPEVLRDRRRDSLPLADAAALLAFHRPMAGLYAQALTAELAYQAAHRQLTDRLAPPPGEAVRPAPPAVAPTAAGESAGPSQPSAGVSFGFRPRGVPEGRAGARPGTGASPGMWAPTICDVCGETFDGREIVAHLETHDTDDLRPRRTARAGGAR